MIIACFRALNIFSLSSGDLENWLPILTRSSIAGSLKFVVHLKHDHNQNVKQIQDLIQKVINVMHQLYFQQQTY